MQIIDEDLNKEFESTNGQGHLGRTSGKIGDRRGRGCSQNTPGESFENTSKMRFSVHYVFALGQGSAFDKSQPINHTLVHNKPEGYPSSLYRTSHLA